MSDDTDQMLDDLTTAVWVLRIGQPDTPLGRHDRDQAEKLYYRAAAFRETRKATEDRLAKDLAEAVRLLREARKRIDRVHVEQREEINAFIAAQEKTL